MNKKNSQNELCLKKFHSANPFVWRPTARRHTTVVCGTYFAGSDTILVFKLFCDVFGGGTRLAMPKTTLRAGLIAIEAWFRGY